MLDPDYVYRSFSDPTYWWGFVTIEDDYVGCFTITIDYEHRTAYMRGLNNVPEYQGQGIGSEILSQLVVRCQEAGVRDIQLVSARNKASFYEKRGFRTRAADSPGMELADENCK